MLQLALCHYDPRVWWRQLVLLEVFSRAYCTNPSPNWAVTSSDRHLQIRVSGVLALRLIARYIYTICGLTIWLSDLGCILRARVSEHLRISRVKLLLRAAAIHEASVCFCSRGFKLLFDTASKKLLYYVICWFCRVTPSVADIPGYI